MDIRSVGRDVALHVVLVAALLGGGCSEGGDGGAPDTGPGIYTDVSFGDGFAPSDTGGGADAEVLPPVTVSPEEVPGDAPLYFKRFIPDACTEQSPCPVVVLVPDGIAGGDAFFGDELPMELAARTGTIVVRYNPPGRGLGARRSAGVEDFNGGEGQDALAKVVSLAAKRAQASDRIGIVSFGFGLSAAAGALARFGPTSMAEVDFLIDVEGPVDRCAITAHVFDPDAGIDGDGVGTDQVKCDFDLVPRDEAFPMDMGAAPPAVLCNPKAFPIAQSGKDCTEDLWWTDREPKWFLPKLRGAYLRLQMQYDHALPSRWQALLAIHFAKQSPDLDHFQLDDVEPNEALLKVGDAKCLELGCYLTTKSGNAVRFPACSGETCSPASSPYAAAWPDYAPMSLETFFAKVLPRFIERMVAL